jgi:hypothetical protein
MDIGIATEGRYIGGVRDKSAPTDVKLSRASARDAPTFHAVKSKLTEYYGCPDDFVKLHYRTHYQDHTIRYGMFSRVKNLTSPVLMRFQPHSGSASLAYSGFNTSSLMLELVR